MQWKQKQRKIKIAQYGVNVYYLTFWDKILNSGGLHFWKKKKKYHEN